MSRRTRLALVAAVAALGLAVAVAPASAGKNGPNNVNAKKCQKDGWESLFTKTGDAFDNSSECTSYAARGGQLFDTPAADLSVSLSRTVVPDEEAEDAIAVTVTNSGPGPATATVEFLSSTGGSTVSGDINLAAGESRTPAFITVAAGRRYYAQVLISSVRDPDSTPGNYVNGFDGPAVEDDEGFFAFPSG